MKAYANMTVRSHASPNVDGVEIELSPGSRYSEAMPSHTVSPSEYTMMMREYQR